jgi:hypothetical protein
MLDEEVKQFVISCRRRARVNNDPGKCTWKQRTCLLLTIEAALIDPKNRDRVLSAITGLDIKSQNQLTFWYHSVLIDETKDGKADGILGRIEAVVTQYPVQQAYKIYPWDRPGIDLPVLQQANSQGANL